MCPESEGCMVDRSSVGKRSRLRAAQTKKRAVCVVFVFRMCLVFASQFGDLTEYPTMTKAIRAPCGESRREEALTGLKSKCLHLPCSSIVAWIQSRTWTTRYSPKPSLTCQFVQMFSGSRNNQIQHKVNIASSEFWCDNLISSR